MNDLKVLTEILEKIVENLSYYLEKFRDYSSTDRARQLKGQIREISEQLRQLSSDYDKEARSATMSSAPFSKAIEFLSRAEAHIDEYQRSPGIIVSEENSKEPICISVKQAKDELNGFVRRIKRSKEYGREIGFRPSQ